MNLVFLLIFLFLSVRTDAKCEWQNFKLLLESKDCRCNDLTHSAMGRIFNGTHLDRRDAPYIAAIYFALIKKILEFEVEKHFTIFCSGAIISPRYVLT